MLEQYREVAPRGTVDFLRQLGQRVEGKRMLHVNSTRQGGGVAEILQRLVRFLQYERTEKNAPLVFRLSRQWQRRVAMCGRDNR